uniref:Uncharacterized protein n=1 Tax=Zea mays TaxID=4577 RepID=A0A804MQ44_MAIZE
MPIANLQISVRRSRERGAMEKDDRLQHQAMELKSRVSTDKSCSSPHSALNNIVLLIFPFCPQQRSRQEEGDARPFVEEAVLQVSDWGFNLSDIQMQKKEAQRLFELIKSLFNQAKREWVGFLGPIHIWQKMFSFRLRTRICRDKKGVPSMAATNWGMKWDITPPTRIRQAMEMQAEVERRKCAQLNQELHSARSSFEQAHFNLCKAPNQDNQHEASSQKIAYNKHGKSMDSYVEVVEVE